MSIGNFGNFGPDSDEGGYRSDGESPGDTDRQDWRGVPFANNIVGKASADAVSRELIDGRQWFQGQGEGPPASMQQTFTRWFLWLGYVGC